MFANMTSGLDFQSQALVLRAQRQRVIAGNIANADTPGYVARDLDFKQAMQNAIAGSVNGSRSAGSSTDPRHIALGQAGAAGATGLTYVAQTQPSLDGNSVDLDRERANFVDNAVRYEATLRFINSDSRIILSAIQGQ